MSTRQSRAMEDWYNNHALTPSRRTDKISIAHKGADHKGDAPPDPCLLAAGAGKAGEDLPAFVHQACIGCVRSVKGALRRSLLMLALLRYRSRPWPHCYLVRVILLSM